MKLGPLCLPKQLIQEHELDVGADFEHRPLAATARPEGGFAVLGYQASARALRKSSQFENQHQRWLT